MFSYIGKLYFESFLNLNPFNWIIIIIIILITIIRAGYALY